jgi:hypothetical protein
VVLKPPKRREIIETIETIDGRSSKKKCSEALQQEKHEKKMQLRVCGYKQQT